MLGRRMGRSTSPDTGQQAKTVALPGVRQVGRLSCLLPRNSGSRGFSSEAMRFSVSVSRAGERGSRHRSNEL